MSEEETFIRLKKPTYEQMFHIWSNSELIRWSDTNITYFELQNQIAVFLNRMAGMWWNTPPNH